jgi:hypothetical protein
MIRTGSARVKAQVGGYGAFGAVTLDVDITPRTLTVAFAPEMEPCWRAAAEAGVRYASERIGWRAGAVRITELQHLTADTTTAVILLAAARAFWDAVGQAPDVLPAIDPVTRALILP